MKMPAERADSRYLLSQSVGDACTCRQQGGADSHLIRRRAAVCFAKVCSSEFKGCDRCVV